MSSRASVVVAGSCTSCTVSVVSGTTSTASTVVASKGAGVLSGSVVGSGVASDPCCSLSLSSFLRVSNLASTCALPVYEYCSGSKPVFCGANGRSWIGLFSMPGLKFTHEFCPRVSVVSAHAAHGERIIAMWFFHAASSPLGPNATGDTVWA